MKMKIEGHEAEYYSTLYYPIYNNFHTNTNPMEYNSIWRLPNLLYVLKIEQWKFINDPQKPSQYHRDTYLQSTLLDVNKEEVETLGHHWKLELKAKANYSKTPMSFDLLWINLTDKYKEVKTFNTLPNVIYVAKILNEVNKIAKHQSLIHYKHFVQTQELQQQIQYLTSSKELLLVESESVKQNNLALTERVKKLEDFAIKVQKMTGKLKINNLKGK